MEKPKKSWRVAGIIRWAVGLAGLMGGISNTSLASGSVPSDVPSTSTWVTNGVVNAIACTSNTIYLGGNFSQIGPATGGFVPISMSTGKVSTTFPKVDGSVYACVNDGKGGWYIGGHFTHVGGLAHSYIAHILADGHVDPAWQPHANYDVLVLTVSGGTVYAGGRFTRMGGQARNHLAALVSASGELTDWKPDVDGPVYALAVLGKTVYVGGDFRNIDGQERNILGAVDAVKGTVISWNPNIGRINVAYPIVNALTVWNGMVYVGGEFINIGGKDRSGLAALDAVSGTATDWNPYVNYMVEAMEISGGLVYIGGTFTKIGGQARSHLAAVDITSGMATDWNPGADDAVRVLNISGGTVYAGGDFQHIGGQARNFLAALVASTGMALNWNPNANASVFTLTASGGTVYAGGNFTSVGGLTRHCLAALDSSSRQIKDWQPTVDGDVNALAVSGGTVYVGGFFTHIGVFARNCLAALDASSGKVRAWDPNVTGLYSSTAVYTLLVSGQMVYVGGYFDAIGAMTHYNLAAVDASTGVATDWSPKMGSDYWWYQWARVKALAIAGRTIYMGGNFINPAGQAYYTLVAVDASSGSVRELDAPMQYMDMWRPEVDALVVSDQTIYVGGNFKKIGGQDRNYLAAVDASSGKVKNWNPKADNRVNTLAVSGGKVYAGGSFNSVGGQTRNRLAALDAATGAVTTWKPDADEIVNILAVSGGRILAGGYFESVGGQPQSYFALFDNTQPPTTPANPGAAEIQCDHLTWTWSDVANDQSVFKIWADPWTAAPTTLRTISEANLNDWTMSGLNSNTPYTFQVAATNQNGDSSRTAPFTTWTLIQPVGGLKFSEVTENSVGVASVDRLMNLAAGLSGVYFSNETAKTASGWRQSESPWISAGLTPNTYYIFRGRSRNGARVSGPVAEAGLWTLAATPSAGRNVVCYVTAGEVREVGTNYLFFNPAGFGVGTHGGNPWMTSGFRWVWDNNPEHAFDSSEPVWRKGLIECTTTIPGCSYYLHLQSYSVNGEVNPRTLDYGPFVVLPVNGVRGRAWEVYR